MNRRNAVSFSVSLALVIASLAAVWAQQASSLVVKASKHAETLGQKATFEVTLTDAAGQPVAAAKNLPITLEVVAPSGKIRTEQVAISAGQKEVSYQVPITEAGVFEVRAKNRELLGGGDLVQALTPKPPPESNTPAPVVSPTPVIRATPPTTASHAWDRSAARRDALVRSEMAARSLAAAPGARAAIARPRISSTPVAAAPAMPAPSPAILPAPTPAAAVPALQKLDVDLRYSPQRRFLANGKDSAKIYALVHGAPPDKDTSIFLFNSDGAMVPRPLVIKKGQPMGEADLSSDQVGKVKLDYWWTDGWVEFAGMPQLTVDFGPPITKLRFKAPHEMTLTDQPDLVVQLTDDNGTPTATDIDRRVSFTIDEGRGEFANREVVIPAGHSDQVTKFLPIGTGAVTVTASSDNLHDQSAALEVAWPVLLILLGAIGGLIGGALAYGRQRDNPWLKILGGLVIGPLLLWALIVGLLPHVLLSRPVLLNPFGTFFVAVIGGWLGTEVFNLLLKSLFGLSAKSAGP